MPVTDIDKFDAYHKWLGIPPDQQPPDHYRLLGVKLFEDDRDVIANAADRQMAHVKTFAVGKHGQLSQKLLDELARAKICLLNAKKKTAYDQMLRERVQQLPAAANLSIGAADDLNVAPAQSVARPAVPSQSEPIQINPRTMSGRTRPPRRNVFAWYLVAVLLAITGALIVHLESRQTAQPLQTAQPEATPLEPRFPRITVSPVRQSVSERHQRSFSFDLRLSSTPSTPVTGQFVLSGTAQPGADYRSRGQWAAASGVVPFTIPANERSQRFELWVIDDNLVEGDESIEVNLANVNGAEVPPHRGGIPSHSLITIRDDDRTQLFVTSNPTNDGFDVQLTRPCATDVALSYRLEGTLSTQQTLTRTATVNIPAGDTRLAVTTDSRIISGRLDLLTARPAPLVTLDPLRRNASIDPPTAQLAPVGKLENSTAEDVFDRLPAAVDLPPVEDASRAVLAELPPGASIELYPIAEQLILSDGLIQWRSTKEALQPIAALTLADDQLAFEWTERVPPESERALRNSVLVFTTAKGSRFIPLRKPVVGEPISFDLTDNKITLKSPADYPPPVSAIYFEFIGLKSLPPHSVEGVHPARMVANDESTIIYQGPQNAWTELSLRSTGKVVTAQFVSMYELPSGKVVPMSIKNGTAEQRAIDRDLRDIAAAKAALPDLRRARSQTQSELSTARRRNNQLGIMNLSAQLQTISAEIDNCNRIVGGEAAVKADANEQGVVTQLARKLDQIRNVPYRFYMVIGEQEVDLMRSPDH